MNKHQLQQYSAQLYPEEINEKFENWETQQQVLISQQWSKEISQDSDSNKKKAKDRPISFSSNLFKKPECEKINSAEHVESDLKMKQSMRKQSLEIETKPSLFATFAFNQQSQPQVPYFKQVQIENFNQVKNATDENADLKAASYSSNFVTSQLDWAKDMLIRSVESENPIKKQHFSLIPKPEKQVAVEQQQVPHAPKGKTMESEGLMHINKNKYQHITFRISEDAFSIQNVPIQIKQIAKVKIFPVDQTLPNYNLLKVSTKGVREELLIALKKNTKYIDFPLPYFTLAKLVIKKLKYLGVSNITQWDLPQRQPSTFFIKKKTNRPIQPSCRSKTKEKIKNNRQKSKERDIKKAIDEANGTQIKQVICQANTYIHGKIFKKSRHFGRWEKRYITINELGIFSYRSLQDENASVRIDRKNIKYIWTWFSLLLQEVDETKMKKCQAEEEGGRVFQYQQNELVGVLKNSSLIPYNKYLIIKLKHGFSEQTQFAIPICNFDTDSKSKNWLYGFYKVLPQLVKE